MAHKLSWTHIRSRLSALDRRTWIGGGIALVVTVFLIIGASCGARLHAESTLESQASTTLSTAVTDLDTLFYTDDLEIDDMTSIHPYARVIYERASHNPSHHTLVPSTVIQARVTSTFFPSGHNMGGKTGVVTFSGSLVASRFPNHHDVFTAPFTATVVKQVGVTDGWALSSLVIDEKGKE